MNRCYFALTLFTCVLISGNARAQNYSFSAINDGLQPTTIRRPYSINDSGTILLQPYTAPNNSANSLLITGSNVVQIPEIPGQDQYYSISNNGYISGAGLGGVYYLDDINYIQNYITVPATDTAFPTGINSSLLVVGMATSPVSGIYAWTSKNGSYTKYVYPGSTGCTLNGVNDSGDMVGTYFTGNSHKTYFAFQIVKGKAKEITVSGCVDPTPSAISSTDIVAGTAIAESGNRMVGFVRSKSGTTVLIDYKAHAPASIEGPSGTAKLTNFYSTEVFGVNASGVVVGMFTGTYENAAGTWAETEYIPFMATPK